MASSKADLRFSDVSTPEADIQVFLCSPRGDWALVWAPLDNRIGLGLLGLGLQEEEGCGELSTHAA